MKLRAHSVPAAVVAVLFAVPAAAGEIVGYVAGNPINKETYDRFTSGFPNAPVVNSSSSFVGAGLDLSGIGWRAAGNWGVTLVSPRHIVTAAHVSEYAVGEQVRFVGADGAVLSFTVATDPNTGLVRQTRLTTTYRDSAGQVQTRPSDLLVVTLATPVSGGITPMAVGSGTAATGTPLLAYGQNSAYGADTRHVGTNTLDGYALTSFNNFASEATIVGLYDYTRTRTGEIALIDGDSGGPLFTRQGDTAVLLGTHYGVSGNLSNPDETYLSASAYLPAYLTQLQAVVAADGETLVIVPIPEPTAGLAVAAAGLAIWFRRRFLSCRPFSRPNATS